ncbi:hypothetical protein TB2_015004 [Malus domestica]
MAVKGIEVHHEKYRLDFYITPLDYNNVGGYEPSSPSVQYVVKFDYHVNHAYFDVHSSVDIGTRRRTLIDQYHEQEEKPVKFDQTELKSSDEELLSDAVSSFGIERSGEHGELHNDIMDMIMKRGCETEQHKIWIKDVEVSGLYVYVGKSHDMYRCGECTLKRRLEEAIEVVKERIRKRDVIRACDDVKEEEGINPTNKEKDGGDPTKKEKEGRARKRRRRNKYYKPARKRNIRVK